MGLSLLSRSITGTPPHRIFIFIFIFIFHFYLLFSSLHFTRLTYPLTCYYFSFIGLLHFYLPGFTFTSYPPVSYIFLFITVYAYIPYILKGILYYRMNIHSIYIFHSTLYVTQCLCVLLSLDHWIQPLQVFINWHCFYYNTYITVCNTT